MSRAAFAFIESSLAGAAFGAMRAAHRLDLETVFVTRDPGYYAQALRDDPQALAQADRVITCDTTRVETILEALRASGLPRPAAVAAIGEHHVPVAAEVAAALGLPGLDPAAAALARNKLETRRRCRSAGVPVPRFLAGRSAPALAAAAARIGWPSVAKPVDGTASTDVVLCRTAEEAAAAFAQVRRQEFNARGQRRVEDVLVEEYLLGQEVSVETVSVGSGTTVVGVTDKQLAGLPYFVELAHAFPSSLPAALQDACAEIALRGLEAVGFDFGVAHTEVKVTARGPFLIEINARPAGDHIPRLVELALGVDLVDAWLQLHLGRSPRLERRREGGAAIRYLTATPGRVTAISGAEEAAHSPGVVEVRLGIRPGDVCRPLRNSQNRAGHVIAAAETAYLASRQAETAALQVEIETAPITADPSPRPAPSRVGPA